ncbi:MAG: hypothetical protein ACI9T8_000452, partial [Candidatus Saccharimonadales bacterium]
AIFVYAQGCPTELIPQESFIATSRYHSIMFLDT